jgi:molybdopterin-containing oxidoreductase family membrane subunit
MSDVATGTFDPKKDETTAILGPGHTFESLTEKISGFILTKQFKKSWIFGLLIAFSVLNLFLISLTLLLINGVGMWGINNPVMWAFDIINFVWWIGIGHAGTLISAILLLLRQQWRTSINRFAEAMTLFAVACAAIFPVFHTGRPWLAFYWLLPYPNVMG